MTDIIDELGATIIVIFSCLVSSLDKQTSSSLPASACLLERADKRSTALISSVKLTMLELSPGGGKKTSVAESEVVAVSGTGGGSGGSCGTVRNSVTKARQSASSL